MPLIHTVYDALKTFDRPATRSEIERESGLSKDEVWKGLVALLRRRLIVAQGGPRQRGIYELTDGAERPIVHERGRYERDDEHRHRMKVAVVTSIHDRPQRVFQAAMPPSHATQPGALRVVVKGILETKSCAVPDFGRCVLAEFWKKR